MLLTADAPHVTCQRYSTALMGLLQATRSKLGGAVAVKDRELDTVAGAVHFCATAPKCKQVSMHQCTNSSLLDAFGDSMPHQSRV